MNVKENGDIEIKLRKFDIRSMTDNCIVVVIAPRGSGKSVLVNDILYNKRHIPIGRVMSHTDHLTKDFAKHVPSIFIDKKFDPEKIKKLMKRQEKALEENWKNPGAFMVMDDVLSDNSWRKDDTLSEVFFNGRHYQMLAIMSMQTPLGVPSTLRDQIDYVFLFDYPNEKARKKLYENYAGCIKNFKTFNAVLDAATEGYGCLVIDNIARRKNKDKKDPCIYHYTAEMHGDYRMCSNDLWERSAEIERRKKKIKTSIQGPPGIRVKKI